MVVMGEGGILNAPPPSLKKKSEKGKKVELLSFCFLRTGKFLNSDFGGGGRGAQRQGKAGGVYSSPPPLVSRSV